MLLFHPKLDCFQRGGQPDVMVLFLVILNKVREELEFVADYGTGCRIAGHELGNAVHRALMFLFVFDDLNHGRHLPLELLPAVFGMRPHPNNSNDFELVRDVHKQSVFISSNVKNYMVSRPEIRRAVSVLYIQRFRPYRR
jgi:hypothetical protein